MLNEPPPEKRKHPLEEESPEANAPHPPASPQKRRHPLEETPAPRPAAPPRQQVQLHITTVAPRLTQVLVAIIVAIFAIGYLMPDLGYDLLMWGANSREAVLGQGEYHRLLTAMFLHVSVAHIFFNATALYFVGTRLEPFIGHLRFAIIYFLGGLAGSIASVILTGTDSAGASGAIFAILGAEAVFLYQHRKIMGEAGRAQLRSLVFIGVMNLALGILSSVSSGGVRIDNWGHIGGLIGGVALAWYISPFFIFKRHPQIPDHVLAHDMNPLQKNYWIVSLYVAVLLAILIGGVYLIR